MGIITSLQLERAKVTFVRNPKETPRAGTAIATVVSIVTEADVPMLFNDIATEFIETYNPKRGGEIKPATARSYVRAAWLNGFIYDPEGKMISPDFGPVINLDDEFSPDDDDDDWGDEDSGPGDDDDNNDDDDWDDDEDDDDDW